MKHPVRRFLLGASVSACTLALATGAPPTVAVYPTGASIPENLLRIELRFARPLRAPLRGDQVSLLDQDGHPIEDALLDLPLPSADGMRVTLLLHPGRIKSGVGAHRIAGRALRSGTPVTLVLDHPSLGAPVHKSWQVVASDTAGPVPSRWTFTAPTANSRLPLTVRLDAAISSASESLIAVRAADGRRVQGTATLGDAETEWRFVPTRPWGVGHYTLVTHPDLEDGAGNRACAAFELPVASRFACANGTVTPFWVTAPKPGSTRPPEGVQSFLARPGERLGSGRSVPR